MGTEGNNGNGNKSKSQKWNTAVANATGKADEGGDAGVTTAITNAPVGNVAAMFGQWSPEDLTKLAETGKIEFAPQAMSLEPGQKIEGILEGMGPGNDFVDDNGVVRHVDSWIIASPDGGLRVSILSSAQLDKKMPPFVGGPVGVARAKDLKIANGHRCADYYVWGPKKADGTARVFHGAIAAKNVPQLPAGHPANAEDLTA